MKRAACVLLPLLLWACEPAALAPPSIVSVEPERVGVGRPATLSVRVSAALPLVVNYEDKSVDPSQLAMAVRIGGTSVDIPFAEPDGTLIVPVPEGLPVGTYDVQVTLADGREAVRERALSVVPLPTLTTSPVGDGGTAGDGGATSPEEPLLEIGGGITGFEIDKLGDQVLHRPFPITIRALGPDSATFNEPVLVRASKGWVLPVTWNAFKGGVLVEQIALSHPGAGIYLLVEDSRGHRGLSNSFRVHRP